MVRSYRGESNLALVAELKAVVVNRILLSPCDEEEHVAFHTGAEGMQRFQEFHVTARKSGSNVSRQVIIDGLLNKITRYSGFVGRISSETHSRTIIFSSRRIPLQLTPYFRSEPKIG